MSWDLEIRIQRPRISQNLASCIFLQSKFQFCPRLQERYGELQARYSEVAEEVARLTEISRRSPDPGMKHQVASLQSSVSELEASIKAKDDELYKLRDEKLRLEGANDRYAQEISTLKSMKDSQEKSAAATHNG